MAKASKKKTYLLVEFPYPSGDGLHVGHVRSYTALDVVARKRRAQGEDVLYPIGWDAFGLPTENFAIKTGQDPRLVTKRNSDNFRRQMKSLGLSFDWSHEINTTDPHYYRWTQWLFLQLWKAGLAYKAKMPINWCPSCKIGLANEEVVPARPDDSGRSGGGGKCERCGTPVEERPREQWLLAITKYARRLYDDLDTVDFPPAVPAAQRHWIGPSEGARIKFDELEVFTTRPETIFGATFIAVPGKVDKFTGRYVTNPATRNQLPVWEAEYVMAQVGTGAVMGVPAHDARDFSFARKHHLPIKTVIEPEYIQEKEPGLVREGLPFVERDGVIAIVKHWSQDKFLGLKWKTVAWGTWITGGIEKNQTAEAAARAEILEEVGYQNLRFVKHLGVAHGKFYHVPKKENRLVHGHCLYFELQDDAKVEVSDKEKALHEPVWLSRDEVEKFLTATTHQWAWREFRDGGQVYVGNGYLKNSGQFDGQKSDEARGAIVKLVGGQPETSYKLRDWIFSRQRYWGEPIPLVWCDRCGAWQAVPDKDLPVKLPKIRQWADYQPTETGDSPLAKLEKWVNTRCPVCRGPARRETDVMPNWAGSSWYYLRYTDPQNKKKFADAKKLKYWLPVDWYNGGMEHTTLHLLYSRFWHKFLYDQKLVPTPEPYAKRTSHGLILAEGGVKMSKSRGNVINPDDIIARFGADALRVYEMFMGPFDQAIAWSTDGLVGAKRFLERVERLAVKATPSASQGVALTAATIKKVSHDIESMKFNTAVSALMILTNELDRAANVAKQDYEVLLKLLSPFAPGLTAKLWKKLGHKKSIHTEPWPEATEIKTTTVSVSVQINGITRAQLEVKPDAPQAEVEKSAREIAKVKKFLGAKPIQKVIYRPGRVVNFVV